MSKLKLLLFAMSAAVFVAAFQLQAAPPAAASAAPTQVAEVLQFATNQLDKPYKLGAEGMDRYDCSGLVYRTFEESGLAQLIGGDRRARGYYAWFKAHGHVTHHPREGDLVVWAHRGHKVSHVGIFYGYNRYGQAMAISALTSGVAIHRVHGVNVPLKAYLRVNFER